MHIHIYKAVVLFWKWVQEIGLQQTSEVITGFQGDIAKLSQYSSQLTNIEKVHFVIGQLYECLAFLDD
jgi:hypothetical protein